MSFGIPVRNGLGIGLTPSTALSSGRIGGRPALILNFIGTTALDSRITFTRALDTATRVNSSGYIEGVNANLPRFDYDPVTLAPKGLLIEESRTNLIRYSQEFNNAIWTKVRATVTADATTSPNNTVDADKLVENTDNNTHYVEISPVATAVAHSFSVFLKAGERTWARLVVVDGGAYFNLSTGAVGTVSAGTVSLSALTPVNMGNGWYRCTVVFTPSAGAVVLQIRLATSNGGQTYLGDGTSGIFAWGAQLEAGAFVTSYIPTVASTVTRSADVATMTSTNFSSWYNQSVGTFVSQFTTSTISGTRSVLDANDSTANESIRFHTVTTNPTFTVTDGGVNQADIDAGTVAANTTYKMAGAYAANNFAASISGGAAVTDVSGTLPTVTQLQIGNSAAGNTLNGCIGSILYYNTRLANSTLQVLTV